jgi:NADPH:quinone reductase-like Zn-dependent oxidoreductase/acyl carrier protein
VISWLSDHKVGGNVVFPGTAYVETLLALLKEVSKDTEKVMTNIHFHRAMILNTVEDITLKTVFSHDNKASIYAGYGSKQDDWKLFSEADFIIGRFDQPRENPINDLDTDFETVSIPELYDVFSHLGLDYGAKFRSLKSVQCKDNVALIELQIDDDAGYIIHPALLDGAFQAMLALMAENTSNMAFLPVKISELRLHRKPGAKVQALLEITKQNSRYIEANLILISDDVIVTELYGIRCDAVQLTTSQLQTELEGVSYHLPWHQVSEQRIFDVKETIALIGMDILPELGEYLQELGCIEIQHFKTLNELAKSKTADRFQQLVIFVDSDSPEKAVSDSVTMTLALQKVQQAGFSASIAFITKTSMAAEIRGPVNNWHSAWISGFRRVTHNELTSMNLRHIDIDENTESQTLASELCIQNPEDEVAIVGDQVWTMQVKRVNTSNYADLQSQVLKPFIDNNHNNFTLQVPVQRNIKSLAFKQNDRVIPADDQLEIKVDIVSMNYKDIAKVTGLLTEDLVENTSSKMTLALEGEGTIVRIGKDVKNYQIGDKVAVAGHDIFQRYITVNTNPKKPPHSHVKRLIDNYEPGQTAASYVAYGTTVWGLLEVAQLKQGETVLIHGATGGIGLAAVNVARKLGAEVIASAGTDEKREYLHSIGINKVVNSRSLNFGKEVQALTKGRGVDVVLNSSPGGIIPVSLDALASFGRFIEIGKGEMFTGGKLDLGLFEKGITYSTLDFEYLLMNKLDYFEKLMDSLYEQLEEGYYPPLPMTTFAAKDVKSAFKHLSTSMHIGKVSVDLRDGAAVSQYKPRPARLDSRKSVIITGGLGGLGLSMANWCVDLGTRRLVLIGRKGAATEGAKKAIAALEARGAEVAVHACDVTNFDSMHQMVNQTEANGPIGGVIHAAGLLDDRPFLEMDEEAIRKVVSPKMIGASNLHELTKDNYDVDFFWTISSVAAIFGNSYQTNYALANTYMDGLMEARQAIGLPGNSIQLGPVDDVGMATMNEDLRTFLKMRGMHYMSQELLYASFTRVLQWNIPIMSMALIEWPVWEYAEPRAASSYRYAVIISEDGSDNSGNSTLETILQLPEDQRVETVGYMVIELVAETLQMNPDDIEMDSPLETFGIDSLTAVELQASVNKSLQVEISLLSMLGGNTIYDIATELVGMIGHPYVV